MMINQAAKLTPFSAWLNLTVLFTPYKKSTIISKVIRKATKSGGVSMYHNKEYWYFKIRKNKLRQSQNLVQVDSSQGKTALFIMLIMYLGRHQALPKLR